MAGRIPDETLQIIRDRVSLVEVVSSYVSLRRAGRRWSGLCPFHAEKTPSFTVKEDPPLFYCFGCHAGGDVFRFVMKAEGLTFPESIEQLARRAGVVLPERPDSGADSLRERLYRLNEEVAAHYQQALRSAAGAEARQYLTGRGVRSETVERYGLGYAIPAGSALLGWLSQRGGQARDLAVQLGLVGRRDDGSHYDRFRGRVMFPIRDRRRRIIGFGGRALGDEQPKYLNSPESPLFHKGESLYGVAEASDAIRSAHRVVLVEGYMDAVMLAQEGVPYVAAVLGTALTVPQLRLLRPFGGPELEVYFFFDGDRAGQSAAERAFGICVEAEVWGKAVFLPEGDDPDTFVRGRGGEATRALIDSGVPLSDFYFDRVAPAGSSLPQRAHAAEETARILARARGDVQFDLLVREATARLGVGEEVFRRGRPVPAPAPASQPARSGVGGSVAELMLLEAIAADRSAAALVSERGTIALFASQDLAQVGQTLIEAWESGGGVQSALPHMSDELASRIAGALVGEGKLAGADPVRVAQDCAVQIERRAQRERVRVAAAALRKAEMSGDDEASVRQLETLNQIVRCR